MPITIGSNIDSLRSQRRLSEGTSELSKTFERLSSGMRINRASDDAAGLSISESLRTDRRVFNQAVRNLNDGVSLLTIADSAIENLSLIVTRLKELAEQSANGTFGIQQRKSLDAEAQALSDEYFRISRSTAFNGLSLFTGNMGEIRLQAGYGLDGSILSGLGGAIGTGTLDAASAHSIAGGSEYRSIVMGDLNGDGIADIVRTGTDGLARVSLGKEDGTFHAAASYQMDTISFTINLADLNGDGILDMISGGRLTTDSSVMIRLGAGDGTFGAATSYVTAGVFNLSTVIGDVNNDGIPDIISSSGPTSVMLGKGDGTFSVASSFNMGGINLRSLALEDLDGDGILDLVGGGTGGRTFVFLGNGNGTFKEPVSYEMEAANTFSVALKDLNGDGIMDMISSGIGGGTGRVTIRFGTGDGTFGTAVSYQMEGTSSRYVNFGDLNGDGIDDMISCGYENTTGYTTIRLGRGDGTFGSAVSYQSSARMYSLALSDINRDGVADIVTAANGSAVSVFLSSTRDGCAPLLPFDLTTMSGARQALPVFTQKLDQLAKQRGTIGAFQSRIEVAVNTLQVASENSAAAASRITDTDVAEESSRLTRLNILQQAASSILAQANLQPSLALTLLS